MYDINIFINEVIKMATKSLETCETCVYGSNNEWCSSGNCKKCAMSYEEYDVKGCRCLQIEWGDECPHYVKEAR